MRVLLIILVFGLLSPSLAAASKTYMSQNDFLELAFAASSGELPTVKTLWLDEELQSQIKTILGHPYPKLRLKYWQKNQQTVWFLEEIGKERPISFGVSVKDNRVENIKVLVFRESRGDEIRFQSFTDQFQYIGVNNDGELDQSIDGITGATMSVNAMKKITRMALLLAKLVSA